MGKSQGRSFGEGRDVETKYGYSLKLVKRELEIQKHWCSWKLEMESRIGKWKQKKKGNCAWWPFLREGIRSPA